MRGWAAVLGILVAVVLVAVILRWMPPYVFIPLVLVGAGYGAYRYRRSTRATPAKVRAGSLGLERVTGDPFGLAGLPFHLLSRGSDRAVEDVMHGTWGGVDVKVFDLRLIGEKGGATRFRCALLPIRLTAPWTVIESRTLFTPPEERVDLGEVMVGPVAFEEAFDVRSDDLAFVEVLLDDRMREWLLDAGQEWGFELRASFLLGYATQTSARDSLEALQTLAGFSQRIPTAALAAYPPGSGAPPPP
jgi:hypothetical protein